MATQHIRRAQVLEEPAPGTRNGAVSDELGETHWLPLKGSKVGDIGEIHYITTASSGLWYWVPDER